MQCHLLNFAEQTAPLCIMSRTFEEVESILHAEAAIALTRVSQATAVHMILSSSIIQQQSDVAQCYASVSWDKRISSNLWNE